MGATRRLYPCKSGVTILKYKDELPGPRTWAIEIKRGLAPRVGRGLRVALDDLKPDRAFVVYGGEDRYALPGNIEVVGLTELAKELAAL